MDLAPDLDSFGWCPFARATGEPCILCGGTRAGWHLLQGDVAAAVRYNAVVVGLLVTVLVVVSTSVVLSIVRRRTTPALVAPWRPGARPASRRVVVIEVVVFALWWLWNLGRW